MDAVIRKLTDDDVERAREVQADAFAELDRSKGEDVPDMTEEVRERQRRRIRHLLHHDPEGSWVAELDGDVVGVALALRRDRLWGLSLLVVDPGKQSRGIGSGLLRAALTYADPHGPAVILASLDPRALRGYAAAGFDLHPQVHAHGAPDVHGLAPASPRVRVGGAEDLAIADEVDLAVRGAPRGPDHVLLLQRCPTLLVVDDAAGRGYAYLEPFGGVHAVAATDDVTATQLLEAALRHDADRGLTSTVPHIAGNQQWAVRVAVAARLTFRANGPVFYRRMEPPAAYLPSGPYL